MMAAEKGHASIVRMLFGAWLRDTPRHRQLCLHPPQSAHSFAYARETETGVDATLATHQSKRTAVWFAKENKHEDIVALLTEFGCQ
jgi:hypothetical protein